MSAVVCFACFVSIAGGSRLNLQHNFNDNLDTRINSSSVVRSLAPEAGGVAEELKESWEEDEKTSGSLKFGDYKGGIDAGVGFIGAGVKEWRSPGVANAGALLQSAGSLVSLIPYPPAAQAIGIGLYLTGGLMSAFAPASTAPTNTDVINAVKKGLQAIDGKLDKISDKLDDVLTATSRLQRTMDVMTKYLGDIYKATVLRDNQIKDIDDRYASSMFLLKAVLDNPNDAAMEHFKNYVKECRNAAERYVFGAMSPENVGRLLDLANDDTVGGSCSVALTYRSLVATRFKLHWILTAGALFDSGGTTFVEPYAERLASDVQAYVTMYGRIKFTSGLLKRTDEDLRTCLAVNPIVHDGSLAVGLVNSTGCPNGYKPLASNQDDCSKASVKFHGKNIYSLTGWWDHLPRNVCIMPVNTVFGWKQFFYNDDNACPAADATWSCPNPGVKWFWNPRPICQKAS